MGLFPDGPGPGPSPPLPLPLGAECLVSDSEAQWAQRAQQPGGRGHLSPHAATLAPARQPGARCPPPAHTLRPEAPSFSAPPFSIRLLEAGAGPGQDGAGALGISVPGVWVPRGCALKERGSPNVGEGGVPGVMPPHAGGQGASDAQRRGLTGGAVLSPERKKERNGW